MSEMINFGIDLGTTNSLIAKFNKGTVEVFKDPLRQGTEVLPSVVGFRNDRILVGHIARTYLERDPKSVASQFKRRMGTTEVCKIESLGQLKTPIELSAEVLKELKRFIHTGEAPEAVVITIPASFEMVQANATNEAGYLAGFKQVVLLSEPIAASLAYANTEKTVDLKNSKWIVYDLGGGTFDVALVKIVEGELKIADHEGDNNLGGRDFDALIVERLIVPQIEKRGTFTDLLAQMKSAAGRFNTLWYRLLDMAERAKIELSTRTSAEIELSVIDEDGKTIDDLIEITRSEYEPLIKDAIDNTAAMLRKILTRNDLRPQDLKFVLMVGGSTLTPFVRNRIGELLGIPVNTGINPTNAIAIGAAYFAATKEIKLGEKAAQKPVQPGALSVKFSYDPISQEREGMFQAKVEGNVAGLFYRITREDGGYDSGLKTLSHRITEDLLLQEDAFNRFAFTIFDSHNNPVPADLDSIQIAQGYGVGGQGLPYDLCLVKDALNTDDTRLDPLFLKNSVIPAKTKRTEEVNRTVHQGSADEVIRVIVVAGPPENHYLSNREQGKLVITGEQLIQDLHKGMDIDLTFDLDESQRLTVTAYINPSGPAFSLVFNRENRDVKVENLTEEIRRLGAKLDKEIAEASASENYEVAAKIEKLRERNEELYDAVMPMTIDDVTEDKFKLDDRKRKLSQELDALTAGKQIERLRAEYQTTKDAVTDIVKEGGNDQERRQVHEVVTREHVFLNSDNHKRLQEQIEVLNRVKYQILRRTPDVLIGWFEYVVGKRETLSDQLQAKYLIEAGKRHQAAEDWDKMYDVICRLYSLLPKVVDPTEEDATRRNYIGF